MAVTRNVQHVWNKSQIPVKFYLLNIETGSHFEDWR